MNAVEAMQDGGELVVSTGADDDKVSIIFSDTGTGVASSVVDRIFFPFFTTKDRGTGLGLSIAYKIIEEHEGKLTVRSVPGIKTAFEIILSKQYGRI